MNAPALSSSPSAIASPATSLLARHIPGGWLLAALAAWLGVGQLLLWRFLDVMPLYAYGLGIALLGIICAAIVKMARSFVGPSTGMLIACIAIATFIMALGGEGRFFYANIDWQVRFAVLRDMTIHPWPFVYMRGEAEVLRAPIGMFLFPALVGKMAGMRAGDLALLVQNGLMLGVVLALLSTLFDTRRGKLLALSVFLLFSGLDALGGLLIGSNGSDHLEGWIGLQFSSTLTLAFWVPNHAMSGWIGALCFMLWRAEKIPLGVAFALLPLTALWSPLGLIGAMPFALLAGVRTIWQRKLRFVDVALPVLVVIIVTPGLLYLAAGGDDVGIRPLMIDLLPWIAFEVIEVLVYIVPLALATRHILYGRDTLALVTVWLLIIPFIQIGWSIDMMMRGSITALTILAMMVVDALLREVRVRRVLIALLAVGSITGLMEVRRALIHPPAPALKCTIFAAWDQSFGYIPIHTWNAPLSAMPSMVRPERPAKVMVNDPARCWDGEWYHP